MALAKWYKIDFHVHTPESSCFPDKGIDAHKWLTAAKESGMNGVVITDHNSIGFLEKIDVIKNEYEEVNKFKVFYGIEVCVSADFTHFIIIFNDNLPLETIKEDVVEYLGLRRENYGNNTFMVSEDKLFKLYKEREHDIFIIPAHFASNKGLGKSNVNAIKNYTDNVKFSAIEVRNDEDLREYENKENGNHIKKCAKITGSDNPSDRDESKHCIEGIGKKFTWIKTAMLDFEGLRQVFIDPDYRVIDFTKTSVLGEGYDPNKIMKNYISGIELKGFKHIENMNLRFSPHFNCIIGARGTGKSTFVESIRASLQGEKILDSKDLLKKTMKKDGEISTYYNFGSDNPHKIQVKKISNKKYEFLFENIEGEINDHPAFLADIYSQKEIYSLVEDDNDVSNSEESPLIRIIDEKELANILVIKDKLSNIISELLTESQKINTYRSKYKELTVIKSEIKSYESLMKQYEESGLDKKREEYKRIKDIYNSGQNNIEKTKNEYSSFTERLSNIIEDIDSGTFDNKYEEEVEKYGNPLKKSIDRIKMALEIETSEVDLIQKKYQESSLFQTLNTVEKEYKDIIETLKNTGDTDASKIEEQLHNLKKRELELNKFKEEEIDSIGRIENLANEYVLIREALTNARISIIEETDNSSLKIEIEPMAHMNRLKRNIQIEFGKEEIYNQYFTQICERIVDPSYGFKNLKEYIIFLLTSLDGDINHYLPEECSESRFVKLWKDKKQKSTLSSLLNILPEDRVIIKISDNGNEIDINEGSPGQKCAAVLAFLLSNGRNPLIIDQPEDDLDNSLIYNLIVKSIRRMKLDRQIIIVSHNPNIPVLGDAEGIIILERNQEGMVSLFKNKKAGCIEEKVIRDGICDIMEGGEQAFKRREMKYMYKNS